MSLLSDERRLVKQYLSTVQRGCPVCGKPVRRQGDAHHLFIRRGPDIPELYADWNIILVHPWCHTNEGPGLNVNGALMKFWSGYTPDMIKAEIENLPLKIRCAPSWFYIAEELFAQGVRPFEWDAIYDTNKVRSTIDRP